MDLLKMKNLLASVADPGSPGGGGERGPPTRALFSKNVCENERIGSRRGACTWHAPPRSANEHDTLQLGLKRNIAIIPMHRDFIFCLLVLVEFAYF